MAHYDDVQDEWGRASNYPLGLAETRTCERSTLYKGDDTLTEEYRGLVENLKVTSVSLEEAQNDHKESLVNIAKFEEEYGFE